MWNGNSNSIPKFWNGNWNNSTFRIPKFLTLLNCIGMWNVEWKSAFQFHSKILEWELEQFHIPHSKILEWGLEQFHIPHSRNLEWNWNVEWKSTFQCTLAEWGMRHSQQKQFHIPPSKILEWNWNVDFHSTFHIPMHFSKVRNETFWLRVFWPLATGHWNWPLTTRPQILTTRPPGRIGVLGTESEVLWVECSELQIALVSGSCSMPL